jgi:6-phosphogluconolactonase/glucosamine-6-phosphate isomerase/deaminase
MHMTPSFGVDFGLGGISKIVYHKNHILLVQNKEWYNTFIVSTYLKTVGNLTHYIRKDKEDATSFFAKDISRKLKEFRDVERRDVLFLSSGGSALGVLDRIDQNVIGPYLTIGIFDERYDPSNKTSNYAQMRKTDFYKRAVQHGCRLIDTSTQRGQTQIELADYYENELRSWRARHPRGAIMATMGIADDGHTAGIMPFPEDPTRFHDLFERERWIIAYDATGKNPFPLRVTTTFTFLRHIDLIGVFMTGDKKGVVFKNLIEGDDCAEMPARIVKTLPRGAIYTDASLIHAAGYSVPNKFS